MTDQHPITPPPKLVQLWRTVWHNVKITNVSLLEYVATQAAQWGADEQLEMDAGWVALQTSNLMSADRLRAEMRPKPPSLKEQALEMLECIPTHDNSGRENGIDLSVIRRALEQLP